MPGAGCLVERLLRVGPSARIGARTEGDDPDEMVIHWTPGTIRAYQLCHLFLHELGHLQLVDGEARSDRLRYARERLAQEFAVEWCERLWSVPFAHPDPVHNAPSVEEMNALRGANEAVT